MFKYIPDKVKTSSMGFFYFLIKIFKLHVHVYIMNIHFLCS